MEFWVVFQRPMRQPTFCIKNECCAIPGRRSGLNVADPCLAGSLSDFVSLKPELYNAWPALSLALLQVFSRTGTLPKSKARVGPVGTVCTAEEGEAGQSAFEPLIVMLWQMP